MKKWKVLIVGAFIATTLAGCTLMDDYGSDLKQQWFGLPLTLETYDFNAHKIDEVKGKSLSITRDSQFDETDEEGNTSKQSKVMKITVGKNMMRHVGSSMIAYEDGLENVMDKYPKQVSVMDDTRSLPFVNHFVHAFKEDFSGAKYVILIRSQTGKPLATFAGDHVRVSKTDVPSSTNLLIDKKRLFVYRCDYTIYEKGMLER